MPLFVSVTMGWEGIAISLEFWVLFKALETLGVNHGIYFAFLHHVSRLERLELSSNLHTCRGTTCSTCIYFAFLRVLQVLMHVNHLLHLNSIIQIYHILEILYAKINYIF